MATTKDASANLDKPSDALANAIDPASIDLTTTGKAHYESSNIRVCATCGEKVHSRVDPTTLKAERFCPIGLEGCTFAA